MPRILLVDDDKPLGQMLSLYLANAGFTVDIRTDGRSALAALTAEDYDLVLLDVMLPDATGYELCPALKAVRDRPVLMLTARDMLQDKIQGFTCGADDYIVKPFEPAEVIARINARLRKPRTEQEEETLSIGTVRVDIKAYRVTKGGQPVDLKPREVELFHYLLRNKNIVLNRDTLLQRVWHYDFAGDTRTVDVHINILRQKLLPGESGWDIKTVWGVGYRLEGE